MRLRAAMSVVAAVAGCVAAWTAVPTARADDVGRARQLFAEGQSAYEAGDFQLAARKMTEAYKATRSPELAFNVGRVYERMSEYDKAIRFFRIYLRRGEPTPEEQRDIQGRIAELASAKRRQEKQVFTAPPSEDQLTAEARTFFKRGVAMFQRGRYRAAMQAFNAAHRFAPLPEVIYNMAVAAERLEQRRDAIDYYREYLRLRDNAPDRHFVEKKITKLKQAPR